MHIRIEPEIKAQAEETLERLGLSTSDAVNLFLRQVILKGGLPFQVRLNGPNAATLAAMDEVEGRLRDEKGYVDVEELLEALRS